MYKERVVSGLLFPPFITCMSSRALVTYELLGLCRYVPLVNSAGSLYELIIWVFFY